MRNAGTRAAPLPAEQRRAGIVEVALPLLRKYGSDVTTKQIADAAGIAEGTIFRVFADKESLIIAVVKQVFDPSPTIVLLESIDMTLPLRDRLRRAVEIIADRLDSVWELMSALRMMGPPEHNTRFREAIAPVHHDDRTPQALMGVIGPDVDQLRVDAPQFARMLRLVTFAGTHPRITDENPLKPDEIVDLLLDGLRAHAP
ncbi:AcrR family transcriptional regulator [Nakamurella sp. UYEF19]|uniref:TetR/AcrR family transcriptional regulator n=1 Tax=Nakamurella sp. UYEF19 TaxID=1756392 RepID=UPI003390F342